MNMTTTPRPAMAWFAAAAAAAALAAAMPVAKAADAFPCQVLKLISPYPAGGTTDILARVLAPGLAKGLGVPVIVDNKAGASS